MKHFCVLPWYSSEIDLTRGTETVCCWLRDHSVSRLDLQQEFLQDRRPDVCQRCWESEDADIQSRRMQENVFLDAKLDRDIEKIADDAKNSQAQINLYQINLGSLCNSTCVTCGPGASTAWKHLAGESKSIRIENATVDDNFDTIKHQINWATARRINLLGGEPLLIKKSFDILEALAAAGNFDCHVSFVTNGSVQLTDAQKAMFKQFTDIMCCFSIDGIGATFDYLRYPLKWEQVSRNIETYRAIFKYVSVSYTVSNLNYHERESTAQWFRDHGLEFIENYVVSPNWFNYKVMPEHPLWPKFVEEVERQDQIKGIKIKDYMPYVFAQIEQGTKTC